MDFNYRQPSILKMRRFFKTIFRLHNGIVTILQQMKKGPVLPSKLKVKNYKQHIMTISQISENQQDCEAIARCSLPFCKFR